MGHVLADELASAGSIAGIIGACCVVGGVLLTQVRRARGKGRTRRAIDEVVVGVPEVKTAEGKIIQPERPGLIDRMDDMDTWRGDVDDWRHGVTGQLSEILERVTPNGGDTNNPGDTALRVEGKVDRMAGHIEKLVEGRED